jgi:hypothetical protein
MKKYTLSALLFFPLVVFAADEVKIAPDETISLVAPLVPSEELSLIAANTPPPPVKESSLIAAVDNLGPGASGFQGVGEFGPEDEDLVDPRILRDFIESRGLIECRKKCGRLTIAGDVRARWLAAGEQAEDGAGRLIKKRGGGTKTALNRFKSEYNLFMDYVDKRSWVSTKVRWTTFDGVDGGSATKPELDRAFIGYDIYERGDLDFYVEVGRSHLDYIFDSRLQFGSVYDGIHLYYTDVWDGIGTFVAHGGPFIVDSFTNHYAWIFETYVEEWADTGFIFKYSIIDWNRHSRTLNYGSLSNAGKHLLQDNPRYRFLISQLTVEYETAIDFAGCKTLYLYGAVLANHDAKRSRATRNKYENKGAYIGFTLGKLCKACDWSFDLSYQYLEAQAVPEFDLSGIGHGNADNLFFSDALAAFLAPNLARGFTNFKGFQMSLLYALTDTLSFRVKAEWSKPANTNIGGDNKYKGYEMSAIYAF